MKLAFPRSCRHELDHLSRYNRDDEAFLAVYGAAAEHGITSLVQAIRRQHGRQRNSKNGAPDERHR